MIKQARPVTNLKYYKNLTKKGNPTATSAKQSAHYYTYGQEKEGERGSWYDPDGNVVSVAELNKWVKASAKEYKYTYTAVLSLRDGEMEPSDFINAMREQKQFQEFRLIRHTDTDRDHAHVMAFRNKTLTHAEFNDWRHTVGDELQVYEYYRIQNQSAERAAERKLELESRRREKEKQLQEEWEAGRGRSAGLGL